MVRDELLKTAKPILFNTEMARAILDGRKTVTRRVALPNDYIREFRSEKYPNGWWIRGRVCKDWDTLLTVLKRDECKCRYRTGDILYVREAFAPVTDYIDGEPETVYAYKASTTDNQYVGNVMSLPITAWHPSIHMPKEAARVHRRAVRAVPTAAHRAVCNQLHRRAYGCRWTICCEVFS